MVPQPWLRSRRSRGKVSRGQVSQHGVVPPDCGASPDPCVEPAALTSDWLIENLPPPISADYGRRGPTHRSSLPTRLRTECRTRLLIGSPQFGPAFSRCTCHSESGRLSADLGFAFLGSAPPLGEQLSAGFRLFSGTAPSAQSMEEGLRGPSL